MIEAIHDLPSHLRERVASALEAGLLTMPFSVASVRSVLGMQENGEGISAALVELDRMVISGTSAAAWLRTVDAATSRTPRPDLVWSGPESGPTRPRHAALLRGTARLRGALGLGEHLCLLRRAPGLSSARAANGREGKCQRHAVVEHPAEERRHDRGGSTRAAVRGPSLENGLARSSKPSVYYDPRALELEGPAGVLHAKAVVIDDEVVFLTSANLTEAALDRTIELGLLVRDHALAASVSTHFRILIERGLLLPLPAA